MRKLLLIPSMLVFTANANTDNYWETVFKNTEEARQRATQIHQPIDDVPTSSKFGMRFHPILNVDKLHRGVDFAAEEGQQFKAAGKGTVLYAEERGDLGLTIAIEHSNGYVTRYGHASKLLVKAGDYVEDQMIIGLVGSTGTATDSHLHFETILDGVHVDPTEITTLYNPNDNFTTLEESINSLLSQEQIETLEKSGYIIAKPQHQSPDNEQDSVVLEPIQSEDTATEQPILLANDVTLDDGDIEHDAIAVVEHHEPEEVSDTAIAAVESHETEVQTMVVSAKETNPIPVIDDKNKSTWAIAQEMVADTDNTIFQALTAIYELNPKAFKYDNIHLRIVDAPQLKLPTLEQIAAQNPDSAKERCYSDHEKLKHLSKTVKNTTNHQAI